MVFLVIVCACAFWFPSYLAITAKIPPADEWQKTTGIIFFKGGGRTSSIRTWLKTSENEISFTCKSGMWGGLDDCIHDKKILQQVRGKQGTVLWYESSSMIPFVTDKRIVELWVNDKKIVGCGIMQGNINQNFMMGCAMLLVGTGMFICLDLNNIRQRRKKEG